MKSIVAFTALLTLASGLPKPTPNAPTALPTVQLRTLGPTTTHFTSSSQSPSTNGHIINVVLGTVLSSLEQDPLLLQGLEIVQTERTLGVACKAYVNHSSNGVVVRSGDGMVLLDQRGSVVQVTALSCEAGKNAA
ncbi:hypothetical protein BKA63DRAFT_563366 [Paraphoma chrysanthemicola]|nr:hypothetical protein BKA63DRAFT_563366 [Paraphoma chrysanthemicola]